MKNSVRNNPNLKAYLIWLKGKIASYLAMLDAPKRADQIEKMRSYNATLLEKDFLERSRLVERIFITNNQACPVIKLIGSPELLDKFSDDAVEMISDVIDLEAAEVIRTNTLAETIHQTHSRLKAKHEKERESYSADESQYSEDNYLNPYSPDSIGPGQREN